MLCLSSNQPLLGSNALTVAILLKSRHAPDLNQMLITFKRFLAVLFHLPARFCFFVHSVLWMSQTLLLHYVKQVLCSACIWKHTGCVLCFYLETHSEAVKIELLAYRFITQSTSKAQNLIAVENFTIEWDTTMKTMKKGFQLSLGKFCVKSLAWILMLHFVINRSCGKRSLAWVRMFLFPFCFLCQKSCLDIDVIFCDKSFLWQKAKD